MSVLTCNQPSKVPQSCGLWKVLDSAPGKAISLLCGFFHCTTELGTFYKSHLWLRSWPPSFCPSKRQICHSPAILVLSHYSFFFPICFSICGNVLTSITLLLPVNKGSVFIRSDIFTRSQSLFIIKLSCLFSRTEKQTYFYSSTKLLCKAQRHACIFWTVNQSHLLKH